MLKQYFFFLTIIVSASSVDAASILFRNTDGYFDFIPGWDHVGLEVGDVVWESHPGNDYSSGFISGFAWDSLQSQFVVVPNIPGVQKFHTRGSFGWNSASRTLSPTDGFLAVNIDSVLAQDMEAVALNLLGDGYPTDILSNPFVLTSSNQKGGGNTFTCVGLVEHLAEVSGHQGGQGFIPNDRENISVLGVSIPILTPTLLLTAIQQEWSPDDGNKFSFGLFDPVDFLVTDPAGRRAGFTTATGLLNEIPGVTYDGDGDYEQFFITNPMPGEYQVDLYGLGEDAFAAISDGRGGGFLFDGFLAEGQIVTGGFAIASEPGDFDFDSDVDGADFLSWQREDGTADGLQLWRDNFGGGGNVLGSELGIVPEPTTLTSATICLFGFCWRKRPKHR